MVVWRFRAPPELTTPPFYCKKVSGGEAVFGSGIDFAMPVGVVGNPRFVATKTEKGIVMITLGAMLQWAIFGLVIGLIARLLYPGRQSMGFIATMCLGIAGSLLGGFIAYLLGFRPDGAAFSGSGWIMSIVGALLVVWIGLFIGSRSSSTGMRPMP